MYNIFNIIDSIFLFDDLKKYPSLRIFILSLYKPSLSKIKATKILLNIAEPPKHIKHHILIRLEMIEDVIL